MTGGGDGHSSGAPVTERLMRPTRAAARRFARHHRIAPRCLPLLLGLAPGGVFPAAAVAGGAVRSYRTVSPLPPARFPETGRRYTFCGTFPGVAPAGRYPAPHLRGARTFLSPRNAGERPSGRLAPKDLGYRSAAVKDLLRRGRIHQSAICDVGDHLIAIVALYSLGIERSERVRHQ